MKRLKIAWLFMFALIGFIKVQSQTVNEIINKFVEANGGKEKMAGVKSVYFDGEIDIMGNKAPSTTQILNGKGFKSEIDFNGQKTITCYTDKGGWTINPMTGQLTATAVPDEQAKAGRLQLDITGPLFQYAEKGHKVELLTQEDIKGSTAHKLRITTAEKQEIFYWLDAKLYYVVKSQTKIVVNGEEIDMTFGYSDHKKTGYGLVMPFVEELSFPGITFITTHKLIEFNRDIDPVIFEMPK
jgi:hypothetical protein